MKKIAFIATLILISMLFFTLIKAQINWTKHFSNPVMSTNSFRWDKGGRSDPVVIRDSGIYKMWFMAFGGDYSRVIYATSNDGINWTDYGPVLDRGDSTDWDGYSMDTPYVLYDSIDDNYKMWYAAYSQAQPSYYQIGHATSTDGINWIKHPGNPVLTFSVGEASVSDPSVVKIGGIYTMWYSALSFTDIHISYATSPDGINWTKKGMALQGGTGEWDSLIVAMPSVIHNGTSYEMWYSGGMPDSSWMQIPPHIGYATSTDGISWTKYKGNPVLVYGNNPDFDFLASCCPAVVKTGSSYQMWYTGAGGAPIMYRIGYATASFTGTDDFTENIGSVTVFPNPSNNLIQVNLLNPNQNYSIEIYSIIGQQLLKTSDKKVIDISNFASGIYMLTVKQEDKILATKIVKQ